MKKYGFLFGAGAEVAYKQSLGGQFALDIFREDTTEPKKEFKKMRADVQENTNYAATWLPSDYKNKKVDTFMKSVFQNIIMSSIEHNRKTIITTIGDFDNLAEYVIQNTQYLKDVEKTIFDLLGKNLTQISYNNIIQYNDSFKNGNSLLNSHYFSALLEIYKKFSNPDKKTLGMILSSIIQLQLGALSEELSRNINDNYFQKKDDCIDIFDDFGELIKVDYNATGVDGLNILLEMHRDIEENQTNNNKIINFAFHILEELYSKVLDYKSLIDANWHYLYYPSSNWAKFCKISIFLLTVHQYISRKEKDANETNSEGYYNLLKKSLEQKNFEATAIATTNYTEIIEHVLGEKHTVTHFNGSIDTWYDPYLNRIGTREALTNEEKHLIVPLLFTQSGTKPMTSINMAEKYVDVYNKWKESDAIVVVGFGFREDDDHIINILRTLIDDDDRPLIVVTLKESNDNKESIATNLKISDKKKIKIIAVDRDGKIDGQYWTEKL